MYDYGSVAMAGDKIITKRHSISAADEIYTLTPADGQVAQLSHENDHIFKQLNLGKVEERWTKTTDGKQMLSWVIYPVNFDANKKYPTLLFCEGGPQSPVSQFWSYRWNFQIMAANDYIIIAPNRRGLPGFGMEWLEQISGDYGGQCMKDYLSAIDDISKEPYVDTNRLGCVGASFGGFSVYWLAGHHDKRFKHLSHTMVYSIWSSNIWKQKKCGSPTGIWVVHIGTKTMQRHNVPLPTLLIVSLINGTLPFSAFTVKRIIEFLLHKVCRRSMQLYCAVFRPNFYYIRMRIIGY